MKRIAFAIVLLVALSCFSSMSWAQLLFLENFDYPIGPSDSLTVHGWVNTSGSINNIMVTAAGPTYAGYVSSGIGNTATLVTTGQDVRKDFTSTSTGSLYASFLVNVTAAQGGDYFFHLSQTSSPTSSFFGRVFVRSAINGSLAFGLSKSSISAAIPATLSDSVYSLNTTYLLVMKYVFNTGTTTDDAVSLFVFTQPTLPSTEPVTPTIGPITTTQTDATALGFVGLRQGSASIAPTLVIDGIRVGQTWADAPLPVQLASFTGTAISNNAVQLDWITLSEINNFGFYIQRRHSTEQAFTELPNSFVPGHGTTLIPQYYTFTDNTAGVGRWFYRLKQVDLNGTVTLTDPIQVDVLTGVKESVPREFVLNQNYPNPFNPETNIKFSVETAGRTTLEIYNILGQKVATLFDDVAEAGRYYVVKFNGLGMTSGVYFYTLQSGQKKDLKKMLLLK